MALSFFEAKNNLYGQSLQQDWQDDYQEFINMSFENASDAYTIQEEKSWNDVNYQDIFVRINHVITDKQTGDKLGDDWRELIFQDLKYIPTMGRKYKFGDNTFLTINTDNYHNVTKSCVVRRCNNVISWYDTNGKLNVEPCCLDYKGVNSKFDYGQVILAQYDITMTLQYNDNTKLIDFNQRFIINGYAYKVQAVQNYRRQKTYDKNSVPIVILGLMKDLISETDDVINNIANTKDFRYSIKINERNITGHVGKTEKLTSTVKLEDKVITNQIVKWSVNDTSKATIDKDGNLVLVAVGTVIVTCELENNANIKDSITIEIGNIVHINNNVITPNISYIYEGKTQEFKVQAYVNNVLNNDTFNIIASGVNGNNYRLEIVDGNTFKIKNIKKTTDKLHIECINNTDNTKVSTDILLKGIF